MAQQSSDPSDGVGTLHHGLGRFPGAHGCPAFSDLAGLPFLYGLVSLALPLGT